MNGGTDRLDCLETTAQLVQLAENRAGLHRASTGVVINTYIEVVCTPAKSDVNIFAILAFP